MKYGIYSVRDKLSGYLNMFLEKSDAHATRNFSIIVNDDTSVISSCPGDYDLYRIGSFDTDSGCLSGDKPEFVVSAGSLWNSKDSISVKEDNK